MDTTLQIVVDAADPHGLAEFWAAALHYDVEDHDGVVTQLLEAGLLAEEATVEIEGRLGFRDVAACCDPGGSGPRLFFQRVPEPKTVKNRMHLDIQVGDNRALGEVERLAGLGARVLWTTADRGPFTTTMADPEGNEFCVT